jgi:transposase InsO family protein
MAYLCNQMLALRIKYIKKLEQKLIKQDDVVFALDVSRQTVSKWLAKYRFEGEAGLVPKKSGPKSGETWNRTSNEIEDIVCHVAEEYPFKGTDWLADNIPVKLDQSTIYRILKRRKIRYYQGYRHKRRKKKAYCLDRPGRELQLDVSFPFGYARKLAVYSAIDDCSRFVFARVMPNHSNGSTVEFLKELIQKIPFNIEAIRTDQGKEFGKKTAIFLKEKGIQHKKNPAYTPQHNGKVERYHRTFKENEACHWPFHASFEELNFRLKLWLDYYNYHKKHTGLGMNKMTPVQKVIYALISQSFLPNKNVNLMLQQNNM